MAQISAKPPNSDRTFLNRVASFIFDVRFLGVLGQIAFVIAVVSGFQFLGGNLVDNLSDYSSQFICATEEGAVQGANETAFKCAFDFMGNRAGFDISDTAIPYVSADSYWRAFSVGVVNLLRVGLLGVVFTTIVGILVGIARLSNNWLISRLALWYVELIRNTPLLIQLFLIYFGVLQALPNVRDSIQVGSLPILLSNRGINLPWGRSTSATVIWILLIIVAYIVSQLVAEFFNRREMKTGNEQFGSIWSLIAFFLLAGASWNLVPTLTASLGFLSIPSVILTLFIILAVVEAVLMWWLLGLKAERTGLKVDRYLGPTLLFLTILIAGFAMKDSVANPATLFSFSEDNITSIEDVESLAIANSGYSSLDEINALTGDELEAASLGVCVLSDSSEEALAINQLSARSIPYDLVRSNEIRQLSREIGSDCQIAIARQTQIDELFVELETTDGFETAVLYEPPLNRTIPQQENLNVRGGIKLTPEFAAVLVGLVIFYGGSLAEIVRAGIQSVSKGQSEAANALGLSDSQRLRLIVLPQAMKVVIPPAIGIYLSLMKDTALGGTVGYQEMFSVTNTTINQSGRSAQLVLLMMVVYLTISLIFSLILNWYNSRVTLVER